MITSITLTSAEAASPATTATTHTGKLVRAYVKGGDGGTLVTITADAANNLPSTEIYTATADHETGVEVSMPSVVYFASQTFTLTINESTAVTAVLIIDAPH